MTVPAKPDAEWFTYAAAVGVSGIADVVLDGCSRRGGRPSSYPQRVLVPEPPGGWADPRLLGWVHEWSTPSRDRSQRGAFYTPPEFASAVVARATDGAPLPAFTVDPACGGGVFLLEILDRLVAAGVPAGEAITRVAGLEIDPSAAETARIALRAWQLLHGLDGIQPPLVSVGDALRRWPSTWPEPNLVVGNPPFASPLKSGAIPCEAVAYRNHHAEVLGPYADLAAIHLWRAVEAVADDGRVAFVAPVSIINTRDTAQLWRRLETQVDVVSVLMPEKSPFAASVRVFVPVLQVRRRHESKRRSLASAVGVAVGIPAVPALDSAPTLSTIARATSGFRDEFYGLAMHAQEEAAVASDSDMRRLVNVGAIDPLRCTWGRQPIRFAKTRWERPVVDARILSGRLTTFVDRQNTPKVLVATQSPVLEPLVDPIGDLVGITPTIIMTTDVPHHVAAVLLAPPVVAMAAQRWFGTGLSDTALRPTASTIVELPLPPDTARWDEAAELVQTCSMPIDGMQSDPDPTTLMRIGTLMNEAYGGDRAVLLWWARRSGLQLDSDA